MSSKEFYQKITELFRNLIKVEYTKQERLSGKLDKKAVKLRNAIQSKQVTLIEKTINQILREIPMQKEERIQQGIILTRKNGKVYEISRNLNAKHSILNNSNNRYYASWIGYLFSDYEQKTIEKKQFERIVRKKLNISNTVTINQYWKKCKAIEADKEETLSLEKLHDNIIISDNMDPHPKEKIVISTVHKAKGKEFEKVYLDTDLEERNEKEDIIDYAKVLYVAITRAKKKCYKVSFQANKYKHYYRLMPDERYIEFTYKGKKRVKGQTDKSIRKIEIGLEQDIDKISFINEEIVGNAKENIEYIKNNIKSGETVDLIWKGEHYEIYHKERKIGRMNIENLYADVQRHLNKVRYMDFRPKKYTKVRVKRVSTIAMFQEFIPSTIQNIYAKTGIWIGIELEGFGEVEWEKIGRSKEWMNIIKPGKKYIAY